MARGDVMVTPVIQSLNFTGAGTNYLVQANNGSLYLVYIDGSSDLVWRKSADGGFSWTDPVVIFTGTVQTVAVWYDRWSGISADLIHLAYTESGGNDILYRSIDTGSSDTLGTQTTVFNGTSVASGGALTIWRSRGTTTLRVAGSIDAGAEDGAWSSTDGGATWGDTIADPSEGATQDQYFGFPGFNADANDEILVFVDASANGLSVKRYDDSGNTWGESTIIADGSFADLTAGNGFPCVAGAVDLANSRIILAAWSGADTLNADLRLFFISDSAVTESSANVVLNSTDDQALAAVGLDTATGRIYVFYVGKSDGSETWSSSVHLYHKYTDDNGANWSSETALTNRLHSIQWIATTPRFTGDFLCAFSDDITNVTVDAIKASVLIPTAGGGGLMVDMFEGGVIS